MKVNGKVAYKTPEIEECDVVVENGFAGSQVMPLDAPDYREGFGF